MKQGTDRLGVLALARADAFETSRDGQLVLDSEGRVLALNAAARRALGLPGTQALGRLARELISGPAELEQTPWPETTAPLPLTLGEGEALARYELTIAPLLSAGGKPLGQRVTLCHVPDPAAAPDASDRAVWNLNSAAGEQVIRRAILEAVAFTAEQFLKNASWETPLPMVLARLGQATGVSLVQLLEWAPNLQAATLTGLRREWVAPDWAAPLGRRPAYRNELPLGAGGLRRWRELFGAGKPVYGAAVDFPETEQRWLTERAILATLNVPIFIGARWWGVLVLNDYAVARHWTGAEVEALQTIASLLGGALQLEQAFSAVRDSDARSRALVEALPDTIYRLARDGRIVDFKGQDEFGQPFTPEHFVGQPVGPTLSPKAAPLMLECIKRALDSRQLQTFEYTVSAAGGDRHFEVRVVPCGEDEVVAIVRNVSERARLEQMKSDFIHRAAHDLRTPLTTASLAASIIQEGGSPEELEQYWKILRTELGRQRELIEELLTVGRLESGTFQMLLAPVLLPPILKEALEIVGPLAEKRSLTFQTGLAPSLPVVAGDRNGLLQVFVNLLDNAIKFSAPGQVVELRAAPKADGVAVAVRDHGMGIPAEDLPNLFERFFRARNAVQNEVQGTGVGLFIAKAIVDQLNGHISVESELGGGTTFEVWLPASAGQGAA